MQVTFVRCLGGLSALWTIRALKWPPSSDSVVPFALITLGFAAAAVGLLAARPPWVVPSAVVLTAACVGHLFTYPASNSSVVLLGWAGLIVAATDGHPRERALLLRICVSCVYGFTALAKTNPSFLAGDQIYWIARTRTQMNWMVDFASGTGGIFIAVATVLTEYFLAVGLWFRRTRVVAAAVGIGLHSLLIPAAALSAQSAVFLAVLNLGLVAMYPAFWVEVRGDHRPPSHSQTDVPAPNAKGAPA